MVRRQPTVGHRRRFYLQIIQRVHAGAVDAHFKVAVRVEPLLATT